MNTRNEPLITNLHIKSQFRRFPSWIIQFLRLDFGWIERLIDI